MTDAQRIVEALQVMLEKAELAAESVEYEQYYKGYDDGFASGILQALSKAQSIAEGF